MIQNLEILKAQQTFPNSFNNKKEELTDPMHRDRKMV